jgi:hypothetical protein
MVWYVTDGVTEMASPLGIGSGLTSGRVPS